jgi:hypothetical protein
MRTQSYIYAKDARYYNEVSRYDTGEWTIVVYQVGTGEPDDPAATIEERCAIYPVGTAPDSLLEDISERSRDWNYFEPEHAIQDVLVVRRIEADREANEHIRDEDTIRRRAKNNAERAGEEDVRSEYDLFWEAVDLVAEDPDNEGAWQAIDLWRARHVKHIERGRT